MTLETNETGYYLCASRPVLALVGRGVRLPAGHWIRIASASVSPAFVDELVRDLFPALRDTWLPFRTFLTDFDVMEFERFGTAENAAG